ncbi:spermidine synthase [Sphingobium algorifonticola]|uniref:Spermidine synthase n=2 Tax=Sphingobium algorifonticola TaxID=2008318 RepID=A0A437JCV7_9SPHN|nr:spermidine synthase [Sphingobium algorifonticola]
MIPLMLLDTADLPDGGTLRLMRRGNDHFILFGRNELMSSRLKGSEEALASLSCAPLKDRSGARVLIGGLGMGFTLRAAQALLNRTAHIVVAELVPKILEWAQGPLAHLFHDSLSDPRLSVRLEDVRDSLLAAAQGGSATGYDAILLDVDNGPDGLIHLANDWLYGAAGLRAARAALRPGGMLAIWSAYDDPAFTDRLSRAGFAVDPVKVRATGGRKGAHHMIWLARKP